MINGHSLLAEYLTLALLFACAMIIVGAAYCLLVELLKSLEGEAISPFHDDIQTDEDIAFTEYHATDHDPRR